MKKKKIMFILVLVILFLLIIAFSIGTSYSKYTTTVKGEGISQIAKWSFKANGENKTMSTIALKDTYDNTKLTDGKIAPGTSGNFTIVVDATGCDVGLSYQVNFRNEKNKPTNLKFTLGDTTVNTLEELEDLLSGIIAANDTLKERIIQINWQWPFETKVNNLEENDKLDTKQAIEFENYTFDVSITGTQLIPTK